MRDITGIKIDELIIHILDPQGQGLVLSDVVLPIAGNQTLSDYFSNHILNTLKEPSTKAARFRNLNPDQPSGACRGLLRKELNLVEGSQLLAKAIYGILDRDHRITAGDLAICLFQADKYPYTRFLAILKIDPSQIFSHVLRKDAHGKNYVAFEPVSSAFTNERLQKCAVIQPLEPRHPEFDMLLLDRQGRGAENSAVARFFSESFLDAVEVFDARKYTQNLSKSLVGAQNRVRERLSPVEEQNLDSSIRQAVTARRLNVDSWIAGLPVSEEVKHEFDQAIRQTIPARDFNLDQSLSQQLMRSVKYRGDYNLKLEVLADHLDDIVISEERVVDDPDRPPYYRIVIETFTWRRTI